MSIETELKIVDPDNGVGLSSSPIEVTHPEKVLIKYQGLKISLQDLLDELNDADLLPESIETQE